MKNLSSRSRVLIGLFAQGYSQTVTIALQFISVPLLIYSWGVERYGAWLVISALSSYLTLADLGFAQVAANEMTSRTARNDKIGATRVFQTTLLMIFLISSTILVVYNSFVALAPITEMFNLGNISTSEARGAMTILSLQIIASIVFGVISAGLRSIGLFSLMIGISATARLAEGAALIVTCLLGGDFVNAASAIAIIRVTLTVAAALFLVRRAPWLRFSFVGADVALLREMFVPSVSFMAYTLGNLVNIQGMTVVAGALFGPTTVASFNAMRTLARTGVTASNMVSHTLQPEYSTLLGKSKFYELRRLFALHVTLNSLGAIATLVLLCWFGDSFLHYWTGGKITASQPLFFLLILSSAIEMIWSTLQTPLVSASKHSLPAMAFLLISTVGLISIPLGVLGSSPSALGWMNVAVGGLMSVIVIRYLVRVGSSQ